MVLQKKLEFTKSDLRTDVACNGKIKEEKQKSSRFAGGCLPKIHAGEVERTCVNIISK